MLSNHDMELNGSSSLRRRIIGVDKVWVWPKLGRGGAWAWAEHDVGGVWAMGEHRCGRSLGVGGTWAWLMRGHEWSVA